MSFAQYVAHLEITPGLAYAPFWLAFIQVLRSTMDQEARQARGQSTQSTIRVSTHVTSDRFTVVVDDQGPGTDWDAVRKACESRGGWVAMETRAGGGTRISFAFSKSAAPAAGAVKPSQRSYSRPPSRRISRFISRSQGVEPSLNKRGV